MTGADEVTEGCKSGRDLGRVDGAYCSILMSGVVRRKLVGVRRKLMGVRKKMMSGGC